LSDALRRCTPTQLAKVKLLCNEYIKDHKVPPDPKDIPNRRRETVLATAACKNSLYQMEMHPCSKSNCKGCPHGPYFYRNYRDGEIIVPKYIGAYSSLPRSVREKFSPILKQYPLRPRRLRTKK
jgi:hypothetical protein